MHLLVETRRDTKRDQAKIQQEGQQGGLVPSGPTDHEKKVDAIDLIIKEKLADAKIMDSKVKAAALGADMKRDQFDGQIKQQEMRL